MRPRISKSQEVAIRGEDGEENKEADGGNIEDVKGEGEDIAVPHSIVDVCPKECTIFDAAQINCSVFNSSRYNDAGVPHLQFLHINILHRLQELYANPVLAAYIIYPWQCECTEDDQLRDIYDGQIWKKNLYQCMATKIIILRYP